jgi:hypothetical protein
MSDSGLIRLGQFDGQSIVDLGTYAPGVYKYKMNVVGNSVLSTLFVKSGNPANLLVEYREGIVDEDGGEAALLKTHVTPSPGGSDKIVVNKVHNKPFLLVTITSAAVQFGVFATTVTQFPLDLGDAVTHDGDDQTVLDTGLRLSLFDPADSKHYFFRGTQGQAWTLDRTRRLGATRQYEGTVPTSATQLPVTAAGAIEQFEISCPKDEGETKRLLVSVDGTVWHSLGAGDSFSWGLRGQSRAQIWAKALFGTVGYHLITNQEA